MKAMGIIRNLDILGRVVLPIELRKNLGIKILDPLEIFVEDDMIILKKYHSFCIFCDSYNDLKMFKGKLICKDCIQKL